MLRALSKERCTVDDFMALISPAAAPHLETMARLSRRYTEERFGKTISMFIPLYITNSCTNSCVYCGFHISNPMPRTILTEEEIENEYKTASELYNMEIEKLKEFVSVEAISADIKVRKAADLIVESAVVTDKPESEEE